MKRLNIFLNAISVIIALITFVGYNDAFVCVFIISITILLSIGIRRSEKKSDIAFVSLMNVWISVFNITYLILKIYGLIDLYHIKERLCLGYLLPFFIAFVVKNVLRKNDKSTPFVDTNADYNVNS